MRILLMLFNVCEKAFPPETWSNWALFVIASVGAYIALKTLRAIKVQARIARIGLKAATISAKAAKASADSLINAEPGMARSQERGGT